MKIHHTEVSKKLLTSKKDLYGNDPSVVAQRLFLWVWLYVCAVAYQKLLSWDPLLELVRIEGGRKKGVYIGDSVHLDLVINVYAPKVMAMVQNSIRNSAVATKWSLAFTLVLKENLVTKTVNV